MKISLPAATTLNHQVRFMLRRPSDPEFAQVFLVECRERLVELQDNLSEWQTHAEDPTPLAAMFQAVHSLKGSASLLGLHAVAEAGHTLEGVILAAQNCEEMPGAGLISAVQAGIERLVAAIEQWHVGEERTIPVDLTLLERIAELVSDVRTHTVIDETPETEAQNPTVAEILDELELLTAQARKLTLSELWKPFPQVVSLFAAEAGKEIHWRSVGGQIPIQAQQKGALQTALTHLLRNIIAHGIESPAHRKATGKPEAGNIELQAHSTSETVTVTLSDDGQGIDPDHTRTTALALGLITDTEAETLSDTEVLAMLFHPGYSTTLQPDLHSGRGLGLSIVQTELGRIEGRVELKSTPGQGTTFTLTFPNVCGQTEVSESSTESTTETPAELECTTIPMVASEPPTQTAIIEECPTQKRILLVDDSLFARQLVSTSLEGAGYAVRTESRVTTAITLLEEGAPFELIISDLELPGLTGWEFAEWCRNYPVTTSTPMIALTGTTREQAEGRAKQAGFDDVLQKFSAPELLAMVESLCGPSTPGEYTHRASA